MLGNSKIDAIRAAQLEGETGIDVFATTETAGPLSVQHRIHDHKVSRKNGHKREQKDAD